MTSPHDHLDLRAQELALHARRGALSEEEERELAELLATHPSARAEVESAGRFLDALQEARIAPSAGFHGELDRRLQTEALSRRRRSSRRQAAATPWTRGWRFLVGKDSRSSGQTAVFLRSAALYVGAASVLVPWLILRAPEAEPAVSTENAAAWIPAPPARETEPKPVAPRERPGDRRR